MLKTVHLFKIGVKWYIETDYYILIIFKIFKVMEQKKNYMKPEYEEVKMNAKLSLMAGSGCECDNTDIGL
jgi:hypothetical protein